MRFLLACLLVCSLSLVLQACRLASNDLVGDIDSVDLAIQLTGNGKLTTSQVDVNGPGFSFEVEVSSAAQNSACIFSAGTPGSTNYIEARLLTLPTSPNMHALQVTIGTNVTSTFGQVPKNTWAQVAFTLQNSIPVGSTSYPVAAYVNGNPVPLQSLMMAGVTSMPRAFTIGYCASDSLGFNGLIDNFRLYSIAKQASDVYDTSIQFFPMPYSDGLMLYYEFNDMTNSANSTVGQVGNAGMSAVTALATGSVSAVQRLNTAGYLVTNVCSQVGISVGGMSPPYFGGSAPLGYSQTVNCQTNLPQTFVVNQRWLSTGGINGISIKTSNLHYWKVESPGLTVSHRTWGGYVQLPRGSDILPTDETTYFLSNEEVIIQAGPYGYIKVTETNGLLNYELGVNSAQCVRPSAYNDYCTYHMTTQVYYDFSSEPSPEMPVGVVLPANLSFSTPVLSCPVPGGGGYRPDLEPTPPAPPLSPAPAPQPPQNPCAGYTQAQMLVFETACNQTNTYGSSAYQKCVTDSCISGNIITIPTITCPLQRLMHLNDPTFVVDPSCNQDCPNDCSGNGVCNQNGNCVCANAWTGPSCASPSSFPCFTVSSPAGQVIVRPYIAKTAAGTPLVYSDFTTSSNLAAQSKAFLVSDSTLMYIARTLTSSTDATPVYYLVFINNDGNGNANGGNIQITIGATGIQNAAVSSYLNNGNVQTTSSTNQLVINTQWSFSGYTVVAVSLQGLSAQNTFSINFAAANVDQVLIGSAYIQQTDFNLAAFKVSKLSTSSPTVTLSGGQCADQCANIGDCATCSATSGCGWCIDTGSCVPGDRSGPWTYGICQNWRYTFNTSVSRRLTQTLAFPVNPSETDVIVTTADSLDLPVEIIIQPRNTQLITWDLVYVYQNSGSIATMFSSYIQSILSNLLTFPNLGVSFVALNNAAGSPYTIVKQGVNPRDNYWAPQAVQAAAASNQLNNGQVSVLNALGTLPIVYRQFTSRAMIFVVSSPYVPNEMSISDVQTALLANQIIPVFLVPASLVPTYTALVNQLNIGIVIPLPITPADNIPQATTVALHKVAGYGSSFYTQAGIIDTNAWNNNADVWKLYGLNTNLLARFLIPTMSVGDSVLAVSQLSLPGYGNAVVENILSDRPVAFAPQTVYNVTAGQSVIVTINGRSLNDLYQTVPVVLSLPQFGNLASVKPELANGKPDGNFIPGDPIVVGGVSVDPLNRIYYTANANSGGKTDTFQLGVTDSCSNSPAIVITITITDSNSPPVTEMLPVTSTASGPALILLEGKDQNNNPLVYTIVNTIHEENDAGQPIANDTKVGYMYQYTPQVLGTRPNPPGVPAQGIIPINNGDSVSDPLGRVVYWPPPYVNSYADIQQTPWLRVNPCFTYQATQTTTPEKYPSNPTNVNVDIQPIHVPPFVWGDTSPAYPNTPPYVWTTPASNICYSGGAACTFPENMGQPFPWLARPVYIYLGGDSIEKLPLDYIITKLDCDPMANLTRDLTGTLPVTVGTVIPQNPSGQLIPGISFLPGADRSNNDRASNQNDYCEITYQARDPTGVVSLSTKTITISITPTNLPPRIAEGSSNVVALEETPKQFVIDGTDPEGDAFDTYITGCAVTDNGEQFSVCLDSTCSLSNRQSFQCSDIAAQSAINGIGLKLNPGTGLPANTPAPPGLPAISSNGYYAYFTSGKLASAAAGVGYQILSVQFVPRTNPSAVQLYNFQITFNVIQLNQAPEITVNNVTSASQTISLSFGESFLPAVSVYDPDVAYGNMQITIGITPQDGSTLTFIDKSSGQPQSGVGVQGPTGLVITGKEITVNSILGGFKFDSAAGTPTTYTITITANDLGNTGQCPHDANGNPIPLSALTVQPSSSCPLTDQVTITLNYVSTSVVRDAAIGASGAAVFIAGIIGAALAVRAFNSKAESSSYKPWDVFHESDAVLSNPLYESETVGGQSGIYEGKQKGLLDGSSSESPQYVGMDSAQV